MQKNPTTDGNDVSRPLPEPLVLTQEETMKVAGAGVGQEDPNLGKPGPGQDPHW